ESEFPPRSVELGDPLLEVEHLTVAGSVTDVSMTVRAGEVLGIFGLVGAGRTELLRAIFGLDQASSGTTAVDGHHVDIRSARQAIRHGLALVPEERHAQGLVLGMSVRENICLSTLDE